VWEGECGANTVHTCMKMTKRYLLKLVQEWEEGDKRESWRGKFYYDILDIL
jgi:hypothetical protein